MNNRFLAALAAGVLGVFLAGCYSTLEGQYKPGVPAIVKDTIESRYERPVQQVFDAAKEVLRHNGTLYGENTINHTLEAKIDNRTIWVAVDEVEPNITRVRVQARKRGGTPDLLWASEIDKQIALRLTR